MIHDLYNIENILNAILCGGILEHIKLFSSNPIDPVVESPLYNIKNSTGNGLKAFDKGK